MNLATPALIQSEPIALFLDLENMIGKPTGNDKIDLPLDELLECAQRALHELTRSSRFVARRAYANWSDSRLSPLRGRVRKLGAEPIQIYSFDAHLPNAADIQIVCDALAIAADRPTITTFVIVSGDGGYVPLVHRLQQIGKTVVVLATEPMEARGSVSEGLRAVADHFAVLRAPLSSQHEKPKDSDTAPPVIVSLEAPPLTSEEVTNVVMLLLAEDASLTLADQTIDGSRLSGALREKYGRSNIWREVGSPRLGKFLERMGLTIAKPQAKPIGVAQTVNVADDGVAVIP